MHDLTQRHLSPIFHDSSYFNACKHVAAVAQLNTQPVKVKSSVAAGLAMTEPMFFFFCSLTTEHGWYDFQTILKHPALLKSDSNRSLSVRNSYKPDQGSNACPEVWQAGVKLEINRPDLENRWLVLVNPFGRPASFRLSRVSCVYVVQEAHRRRLLVSSRLLPRQSTEGKLSNMNSSRLAVDEHGSLWFSHVAAEDASQDALYACAAFSAARWAHLTSLHIQGHLVQNFTACLKVEEFLIIIE